MATTATIPIHLAFEAARHVARLGLWTEFEAMIEHTRQVVPEARAISARLDRSHGDSDPIVLIQAEIEGPGSDDERTEWHWDRWVVETYPPDVTRHFCMMAIHGRGGDGR